MEELEKKLGYTFRDPELLRAALYALGRLTQEQYMALVG